MSLPFYKITCSNPGCSFDGGYNFSVDYQYEGIPAHEPELQVGWCRSCDKIEMIARPFNSEDARIEIEEFEKWTGAGQPQGFFSRFSKEKKAIVAEYQQLLTVVGQRQRFFETKPFQSRCINCGGFETVTFQLPYGDYDETLPLNVEHVCGGQLLITMLGRLNFMRRPKVVYDEEGNVLLDERNR